MGNAKMRTTMIMTKTMMVTAKMVLVMKPYDWDACLINSTS